jgi:membrane protein DedA with SNARE-associated domain
LGEPFAILSSKNDDLKFPYTLDFGFDIDLDLPTRYIGECRVIVYLINNIDNLFTFFDSFGYLGILLVSFIGSIIIFVPIPYFPVLVAAAFDRHLNPNLIALCSAVGSLAGKMIVFYASFYGYKMLNYKTKKRMLPLHRLLGKYGGLGAFIAASIPVPDDLVYITLGLTKYSPWRFATAVLAGKILLKEITVWGAVLLGRPFFTYFISNYNKPESLASIIAASVIILALVLYASLKIDWGKIIGRWFPWTLTEDTPKTKGNEEEKEL